MGELYYLKQKSVICSNAHSIYFFAKFNLLFYFRGKRKIEKIRIIALHVDYRFMTVHNTSRLEAKKKKKIRVLQLSAPPRSLKSISPSIIDLKLRCIMEYMQMTLYNRIIYFLSICFLTKVWYASGLKLMYKIQSSLVCYPMQHVVSGCHLYRATKKRISSQGHLLLLIFKCLYFVILWYALLNKLTE